MSSSGLSLEVPIPDQAGPIARRAWSGLTWAGIACVLLVGSGVVRALQESQHESEKSYREVCPIDLAKVPTKLGDWHVVGDAEKKLDDMTMRITGGTDHTFRTYANDYTGVSLMVLILFGPAEPVLPHTPEVCYPSSGFSGEETPSDRSIKFPAGQDSRGRPVEGEARFRSAAYHKAAGRGTLREAVYHSFRLDGQWSPDIGKDRKFPRRNPGIFKVQVQRLIGGGETLGEGDPIEQFLSQLLADLEREVKATTIKAVASK